MKKILFGLIATVFFGLSGFASDLSLNKSLNSDPILKIKEKTKVRITLDVDWGRKSKGCTGFGVCDVDIVIEVDEFRTGFSASNNGSFTLEFDDKGLKSIYEHFKSDSTLKLEENYVLSDKVCKALELKSGYTLKKGNYKIQKTKEGTYSVSF